MVFASEIEFDQIVIVNAHDSGIETTDGIRNVTITASTDVITDVTYLAEISNPYVTFEGIIPEHAVEDISDDYDIPITLSIASADPQITAKSVIFDIDTSWGTIGFTGVRSIDFYFKETLISLENGTDFTAHSTSEISTMYDDYRAFDTSFAKDGRGDYTSWLSNTGYNGSLRLIIVFATEQTFDSIVINNYHMEKYDTDRGIRQITINSSESEITSTVHNEAIPNATELFSGEIPIHAYEDAEDPYVVPITPAEEEEEVEYGTHTAKSFVFDIDGNHGSASFIGIRSVEFYLNDVLYDVTDGITAYSTAYHSNFPPATAFYTTFAKTGTWSGTSLSLIHI